MSRSYSSFTAFSQDMLMVDDAIVEAASSIASDLFDEMHLDRFGKDEELFDQFRYEFLEDAIQDAIQDALDSIDMASLRNKWSDELKEWQR